MKGRRKKGRREERREGEGGKEEGWREEGRKTNRLLSHRLELALASLPSVHGHTLHVATCKLSHLVLVKGPL